MAVFGQELEGARLFGCGARVRETVTMNELDIPLHVKYIQDLDNVCLLSFQFHTTLNAQCLLIAQG